MKKIIVSALAVALIAGFGNVFGAEDLVYIGYSHILCTDYTLSKAKGQAITDALGKKLGYWYQATEKKLRDKAREQGSEGIHFSHQYVVPGSPDRLCRVYFDLHKPGTVGDKDLKVTPTEQKDLIKKLREAKRKK